MPRQLPSYHSLKNYFSTFVPPNTPSTAVAAAISTFNILFQRFFFAIFHTSFPLLSDYDSCYRIVTESRLAERVLLFAAIRTTTITTVITAYRAALNTVYIFETQAIGTCSSSGDQANITVGTEADTQAGNVIGGKILRFSVPLLLAAR